MLPFFFALIYLGADTPIIDSQKINIKDRVSILTGVCIAIFYVFKLIKEISKRDENNLIKNDIKELKEEIKLLKSCSQLPHDESSKAPSAK